MIPAIIIGIIAAISFYYVLEPIILKTAAVSPSGERELRDIEIHYREALRELEYDLESGKIDEQEFEMLRKELEDQLFGEKA